MSFGEYSFLPWLRRGIANEIQVPATGGSRASVSVAIEVKSDAGQANVPAKSVFLVGPGDVIGIDPQMVVRTEPRRGVTNFEPNYLAYVDFYDEDFAWRYTPDRADTASHRLTPWITLLVLKDGEYRRRRRKGLTAIELTPEADPAATLPPHADLWAWAHVHLNASIATGAPNLDTLGTLLTSDPDGGYCRLLSPRRLDANTRYTAFIVPTFEVGRLAGLNRPVPDTSTGLASAWVVERTFPVYYEWWFRTGARGDFEDLVEALQPRDVPAEVGVRQLDVQQPGFHTPPTTGQPGNVVGLEGVLRAPTMQSTPVSAACDLPATLAAKVNVPADLQTIGVSPDDDEEDPIISVPLYGRWHALVDRVKAFPEHRNWVNELNTDPRYRAVTGMATKVIQKHQETYMKLAWEQIGDVVSLNRKVSLLQFAIKATDALYARDLATLPPEHTLAVAAPVLRKVLGSPVTIHTLVNDSRLPRAALDGAMRKQLRPRGPLASRAFPELPAGRQPLGAAIAGLNDGTLTAAPPRPDPKGSTYDETLNRVTPKPPRWLRWLALNRMLALVVTLALLLVMFLAAPGIGMALAGAVLAGAAFTAYRRLEPISRSVTTAEGFTAAALTPQAIEALPPNAAFVLPDPDAPLTMTVQPAGGNDSPQGAAFRAAAADFNRVLSERPPAAVAAPPLALAAVRNTLMQALQPAPAFMKRYGALLTVGQDSLSDYVAAYRDVPAGAAAPVEPRITQVMAYPDIKLPMYQPLKDLQRDNFVPNLHLVPPDTISLMLTNPAVIEAYMVGLNHEFARELLWREYPTDQRGSTFRQFWDPSNYVDTEGLPPKALAEKLRDITRLHEWAGDSLLGAHNNRVPNDGKPRVVLVIRGELLKRYPNTIIYAQKARWGAPPDHENHLSLYDETGAKAEANPKDPNFRFPMFRAQVEPDVYFVGFDLLLDEAKGHAALAETAEARASIPADQLGWFFVLQEVVGEPRFGLDERKADTSEDPVKWSNLSWEHLGNVPMINFATPFASQPAGTDTAGASWGSHAADMAFILYQKPVLVGVHAREMLKNLTLPQ